MIRRAYQPLEALAQRTRLQMTIRFADASLTELVTHELASARGGNGLVRLVVPLASGGDAVLIAGRDFTLDAELAARVARVTGEGSVDLSIQEPPKLALVG